MYIYIPKNNGNLEKYSRCKTSRQRKRLFKVNMKTKLYVTQYILQQFTCDVIK